MKKRGRKCNAMFKSIFSNIMEITLSTSIVIALLLLLSNRLDNKYHVKWRYWIWLIISIRLILPFTITIPDPPIHLSAPEVIQSEATQSIENRDIKEVSKIESDDIAIENIYKNVDDLKHQNSYNYSKPTGNIFDIEEFLTTLWVKGLVAFLIYHLIIYFSYRKSIKPWCYELKEPKLLSIYEKICKEIEIKKIPIIKCKRIKSPMVMGVFKKVLLLPDETFSKQHLEMILRHELIHVKRNDILYKSIILLARAVHWFNPFVHIMAIKANKDIELSCDAMVVENRNMDYRKTYSKAILSAIYKGKTSKAVFSTYFGGGKEMLKKRFNNLFDFRKKKKGFTIMLATILLLATLSLCISCTQGNTLETPDIITYENEALGFSLKFPKEWKDRYTVEEKDNRIEVFSKKNHEFGGLLFSIERLIGELITEEDMKYSPVREEMILKGNGYTYIVRYPSDMQYSLDDEKLNQEYESMFEQIPDILKSINILGDKYPKASNEGFKVVGSISFIVEIPSNWEIHASQDWPLIWELYVGEDKDSSISVRTSKVGEIEMVPYHMKESDDQRTTAYVTNKEIFRKARISLDIDDPNREIIDKIKNSFVFTGGAYTVVDLQTDAQRYLDGGSKKIFGQIESFAMEDEFPVAVQINVMEFVPDGSNDNNPNGFHIKDLNKTEKYSTDLGVSVAPLVAPNYNTYGAYNISNLDQTFIENHNFLKNSYYDFIIDSNGQLKIMFEHYIP